MVLPTREVADTVGPIVERLLALDGLIDQVLVVDADSRRGTRRSRRRWARRCYQESQLLPEFGRVLGKGDAMWRALDVAEGELSSTSTRTRATSRHFATGMLGPLICEEQEVSFVKGHFRRPYAAVEGDRRPVDGGRVTELTARPLLSAFYPELAAFVQPLAGEVAARRSFFDELPSPPATPSRRRCCCTPATCWAAPTGWPRWISRSATTPPVAGALGPMAYAVLRVILERLRAEGRLTDDHAPPFQTADGQLVQVELVERPPYATLRARA